MSTQEITFAKTLPPPPARLFCVGIGGIGVSGLAQLLSSQGYTVAGSDRGITEPGKAELYEKLRKQGIRLYPQDGSGVKAEKPDAFIISTAVEPGNPDLIASPDCPVIHRARALAQALDRTGACQIAIAGSCGKTSVTGWIASALKALGQSVVMVNGGYVLECESDNMPGNFMSDLKPKFAVVEVDESDKSLCEFTPDYGLLLNVGNDHYSQDELKRVFADYLRKCRKGIILLKELAFLAEGVNTPTTFFSPLEADNAIFPENYTSDAHGISFIAKDFGKIASTQSGRHSALNACAVLALLRQLPLNLSLQQLAASLAAFRGIRQRFEIVGNTAAGIPVINDYAHNPEKVQAAIATAHERFGSPIIAAFQPHGFKPLQFMREPLVEAMKDALLPGDSLILLPVFYAGGTASFSPTSDDVAADMKAAGLSVCAGSRNDFEAAASAMQNAKCLLVMGARDSSLRTWSCSMAYK